MSRQSGITKQGMRTAMFNLKDIDRSSFHESSYDDELDDALSYESSLQ